MGEGVAMEGWVCLLHANKLRLNRPRKRYLVLVGNKASYKEKPSSHDEALIKTGIIGPSTRVIDGGRESIHSRVLFVFTLVDAAKPEIKLKLGARSAEEAAKWMQAFRDAAERAQCPDHDRLSVTAAGRRRLPNFRRSGKKGSGLGRDVSGAAEGLHREDSTSSFVDLPDWTGSLLAKDASPDVVASSPWQIFGCKNGLRLFKETSDNDGGLRDKVRGEDPPALMSVGVVHSSCVSVFETVMALGPSRAEWDFCFAKGKVLERIDGHTDIVHKQFHSYWLPWRLKPRDMVIHRYWRRENDGSYVILYHSVDHQKCPPLASFKRAVVLSGGFVISPLQPHGSNVDRCMVKHMMCVDWRDWQAVWKPSRNRNITLIVLERVAAIRELYKVKERPIVTLRSEKVKTTDGSLHHEAQPRVESSNVDLQQDDEGRQESLVESHSMFLQLADDEFYDAEESSWERGMELELDSSDEMEGSADDEDMQKQGQGNKRLSAAATIRKRFQDLASVQKTPSKYHGTALGTTDQDDIEFVRREGTLPPGTSSCSWNQADPGTFLIRGKQYLRDHKKVKACNPVMQLVAADWFKSNKREDHIAEREGSLIQKLFSKQKTESKVAESFFFVINLQVPGATSYNLVLYYMVNEHLQNIPLLENFVRGDDRYRNSRFKLCPNIAKGSWIVKQSVGKTACLVGEALDITYYASDNHIELDIDIGSSSVAKGVVNLVSGYLGKLVIEMAFLIQANTEEELPEHLLGTVQLSNLDMHKSVPPPQS